MSLRRILLSALFALAACCTCNQVRAQSANGYAPVLFYNVPNFYCCNFQWIRYPTPTDAFKIPWLENTAACNTTPPGPPQTLFVSAYSINAYPSYPSYPSDALYGAKYHYWNCYTGEQFISDYWSDARQWAYCGGDPNNINNYSYSPNDWPGGECPPPSGADPDKNHGNAGCQAHCFGDPINAGTAGKFERETEYKGTGPFPLKVEWAYVTPNVNLTTSAQNLILGADRVLSYQRSITVYKTVSVETAYVARPDGNTYRFNLVGSTWVPDPDIDGTLTSTQNSSGTITGWNYLNRDGEIETYNDLGRLISIQNNQGFEQQLSYNSNGQLVKVIDPLKRSLIFQYNTAGQINTITEPDGGQLILGYDTNGNNGAAPVDLQTITYPDGNKLTYVYQGFSIPWDYIESNILSGIIDENGSRYSSTQYNPSGQAIGTFLSGKVDAESATYTVSSDETYQATAVITKALGETDGDQYCNSGSDSSDPDRFELCFWLLNAHRDVWLRYEWEDE